MDKYFWVQTLVEGQTEATLINNFLVEHFRAHQINHMDAILATTRQAYGKLSAEKGGLPKYSKVRKQILDLLENSSVNLVTTMFDFYRLPADFPGMQDDAATHGTCYQQVAYLEDALKKDINHPRFMAYFSLHEVEALLFTQPEAILQAAGVRDSGALKKLRSIRDAVQSPEEINKTHSPSRRIREIVESYRKVGNIVEAVKTIGLPAIRQECPHFNQWIERIESLAS